MSGNPEEATPSPEEIEGKTAALTALLKVDRCVGMEEMMLVAIGVAAKCPYNTLTEEWLDYCAGVVKAIIRFHEKDDS